MQGEPTAASSAAFANALATLKRDGCNILVVGRGVAMAHEAVCQRFLDPDGNENRPRLIVTAPKTRYRGHGCVAMGSEQTETTVVEYTPPSPDSPTDARPSGDQLTSLGTDVIEAVSSMESADTPEPGQLRVCADSLVPLLSEHDTKAVFKLLHLTTTAIKRVSGMGHYHLPLSRDHDAVSVLEPLFDAILEVRVRNDELQQRWEIRDHDVESEWIEL